MKKTVDKQSNGGYHKPASESCALPEEEVPKVARIEYALHPDLKDRIVVAAAQHEMTMNEFISMVLAKHFGEPKLAEIPRKRWGRKPKLTVRAQA